MTKLRTRTKGKFKNKKYPVSKPKKKRSKTQFKNIPTYKKGSNKFVFPYPYKNKVDKSKWKRILHTGLLDDQKEAAKIWMKEGLIKNYFIEQETEDRNSWILYYK